MNTRAYLGGLHYNTKLLLQKIATMTDDEVNSVVSEEEAFEMQNFVRDILNQIMEN
jgi:hypothetical protein